MNAISRDAGNAAKQARWPLVLCLIAPLLAWSLTPLAGQTLGGAWTGQPVGGMWAAQTGPDQVSLAWDSVPGVTGYQVWVGAPDPTGILRPAISLSARARQAVLFGVDRLSVGVWLVARGANGAPLQQAQFNPVMRQSGAQVLPPTQVTATATGTTEVTLSWSQVGGATAYSIMRSVSPSGLLPACALCSTMPKYVDHNAIPGATHSYAVSAIFPNGVSKRTMSNAVTPGTTPVPTSATATSAPTTTTWSTTSSYDSLTGRTTTVTTQTVCTTTAPISCRSSSTTSVAATGTPTGGTTTSTGSSSPTPATGTSTTTTTPTPPTTTGTTSTTAGTASTTTTSGSTSLLSGVLSHVIATAPTPPASVSAVLTGAAAVRVSWTPSTSQGITMYRIDRRVNGGPVQSLDSVYSGLSTYSDVFFPTTLFAAGPIQVTYLIRALSSTTASSPALSNAVTVTSPAPSTGGTACKLDYQRADNMWAAFGRPDGFLGTETISQAAAQDKVFVTDWKYEKTRNDGTNYYGSHLRVATNSSTHTIRLQLRTLTLTGLFVWLRTGADTFWIRLGPGQTLPFQADLMEVYCE